MAYQNTHITAFSGLNTGVAPDLIKDSEFTDLVNMRQESAGKLVLRNGSVLGVEDTGNQIGSPDSCFLISELGISESRGDMPSSFMVYGFNYSTASTTTTTVVTDADGNVTTTAVTTTNTGGVISTSTTTATTTGGGAAGTTTTTTTAPTTYATKIVLVPLQTIGVYVRDKVPAVSGNPRLKFVFDKFELQEKEIKLERVIRSATTGEPQLLDSVQSGNSLIIADPINGDLQLKYYYDIKTEEDNIFLRSCCVDRFVGDIVNIQKPLTATKSGMGLYGWELKKSPYIRSSDNFATSFNTNDDPNSKPSIALDALSSMNAEGGAHVKVALLAVGKEKGGQYTYDVSPNGNISEDVRDRTSYGVVAKIQTTAPYTFTNAPEALNEEYHGILGEMDFPEEEFIQTYVDEDNIQRERRVVEKAANVYVWEDYKIDYSPIGVVRGNDLERFYSKKTPNMPRTRSLNNQEVSAPLTAWQYIFVWEYEDGTYSAPSAPVAAYDHWWSAYPDELKLGNKFSESTSTTIPGYSYDWYDGEGALVTTEVPPTTVAGITATIPTATIDTTVTKKPKLVNFMNTLRHNGVSETSIEAMFESPWMSVYMNGGAIKKNQLFYKTDGTLNDFGIKYNELKDRLFISGARYGVDGGLLEQIAGFSCLVQVVRQPVIQFNGVACEVLDLSDKGIQKYTKPMQLPLSPMGTRESMNSMFTYKGKPRYLRDVTEKYFIVFRGSNSFIGGTGKTIKDPLGQVVSDFVSSGSPLMFNVFYGDKDNSVNQDPSNHAHTFVEMPEYSKDYWVSCFKEDVPAEVRDRLVLNGVLEVPLLANGMNYYASASHGDKFEPGADSALIGGGTELKKYNVGRATLTGVWRGDGAVNYVSSDQFTSAQNLTVVAYLQAQRLVLMEQLTARFASSVLFEAPMVKIGFVKELIPKKARKVHIFRTQANVNNSWVPNQYGLVDIADVSPSADFSFFDNIKDRHLNFGVRPDMYEGMATQRYWSHAPEAPLKSFAVSSNNERMYRANFEEKYQPVRPVVQPFETEVIAEILPGGGDGKNTLIVKNKP